MSLRVLCLDIEGGYGGSSRSLYEFIRYLRSDVTPEVWCRRQGPIQDRYSTLGVPCHVTPDMPHISSLPRLSRNLYAYGRFFLRWKESLAFRQELVAAARRFDVIHFNHEGLFILLSWLRRHLGSKRPALTMHVRTHLPSTIFSRWQFRTISRMADRTIFITENERQRAQLLAGRTFAGQTIYNVVSRPLESVTLIAALSSEPRFKVLSLGNYAFIRGIDRLIDVAIELDRQGRKDVVFVVAGNMKLTGSLPGLLGDVGQRGGDLADYARERGIATMFRFLGHVANPEAVLAGCDVVVRPTRENNPWGRDVLEAMAYGLPVLSIGSYDRFVETGVTGILYSTFDPSQWANDIVGLAQDSNRASSLGRAGQERVLRLCEGPARAADLSRLWQEAKSSCAA